MTARSYCGPVYDHDPSEIGLLHRHSALLDFLRDYAFIEESGA